MRGFLRPDLEQSVLDILEQSVLYLPHEPETPNPSHPEASRRDPRAARGMGKGNHHQGIDCFYEELEKGTSSVKR